MFKKTESFQKQTKNPFDVSEPMSKLPLRDIMISLCD